MPKSNADPIAWTLERYFTLPEGDELRSFLEVLQVDIDSLNAQIDGENQTCNDWPGRLLAQEAIEARLRHLSAYVYCIRSSQPNNVAGGAILTAEVRLATAFEAVASRVSVALQAMSAPDFETLCDDPVLEGLRWRLCRLRAEAASRLPPDQERLAGDLLQDSLHGWSRLANEIFNDLTFEVQDRDGGRKLASYAERYVYFWAEQVQVRRSAYRGYKTALGSVEKVLAACLNGMTGARASMLRHRGLEVIDEVVTRMAISRSTLETMMGVLHTRRGVLQHYLNLKRQTIGLGKLEVPDRWAPLAQSGTMDPREALNEVSACFARAFPPMAKATQAIRANRWIDFKPGSDKFGSGFCVDSPLVSEPRVYLNVPGSLMGRTVVAHELGHAFHFMAMKGLRPGRRLVPSTLAETASICAEHFYRSGMLTKPDISPEQRLDILGSDLDAAVNYLLRIPRDYEIERKLYSERSTGELTAGRLKALSRQTHRRWFDDVFAPDGDEYAWTAPLFYSTYSNFFNFPYAFGYLLSRRIAEMVEGSGVAAAAAYTAFLRATGSMTAEEAAWTTMGIDLTDQSFWHQAFDGLEQRVSVFEQVTLSWTAAAASAKSLAAEASS